MWSSVNTFLSFSSYSFLHASVSEDQSILAMPPWKNPTLILADLVSLALHFVILEVPYMSVSCVLG